jgi:3-methyladenine DNA glycosylase AlkD
MPATSARSIKAQLQSLARPLTAKTMQRFFKTGPGQYGEGDVFIGISVPVLRAVAMESLNLPMNDALQLLKSPIHEHRAVALMIMVEQFQRGTQAERKAIYDAYLAHTRWINNWDLVDLSAVQIVGGWLENRSRGPLMRLAKSESVWERRIAIVSTLHFIRRKDFASTFAIAERLMADKHDLIHKAVGWMLREVYKRDPAAAIEFLERHQQALPRTSLRYAIERCDPATKARLMAKTAKRLPDSTGVGRGKR